MSDYLEKIKLLDKEIAQPAVHRQAVEIQQIIKAVSEQKVLLKAPAKLGLLPDEAALIGQQSGKYEQVKIINQLFNSLRQYLSLHFGIWSLPNLEAAFLIKKKWQVKQALEIMAGNAYWSKALAKTGVKAIATDSSEWSKTSLTGQQTMMPLKKLSAERAIEAYRQADLILCSWAPNFGQADLKAIAAWRKYNPQSRLLFIGEKGVTNSAAFWQEVTFASNQALHELNAAFTSFDFIDEKFFEVKNS